MSNFGYKISFRKPLCKSMAQFKKSVPYRFTTGNLCNFRQSGMKEKMSCQSIMRFINHREMTEVSSYSHCFTLRNKKRAQAFATVTKIATSD